MIWNHSKIETLKLILQIPSYKKFIIELQEIINSKDNKINVEYLIAVIKGKKEFNKKYLQCKKFIKKYKEQIDFLKNNNVLEQLNDISKINIDVIDEMEKTDKEKLKKLFDRLQKLNIDYITISPNEKFEKTYQHNPETKIYTYLQNMKKVDSNFAYSYQSNNSEYEINISTGEKGKYYGRGMAPYVSDITLISFNINPDILPNNREVIISEINQLFNLLGNNKSENNVFSCDGTIEDLWYMLNESVRKIKHIIDTKEKNIEQQKIHTICGILKAYGYNPISYVKFENDTSHNIGSRISRK